MFDFFDMADTYEDRKIARLDGKNELLVSTAMVTDSEQPFETAIAHPNYNTGQIIIVEMYNTKSDAEKGHSKWVKLMTAKKLPDKLLDVSTASIAVMLDVVDTDSWRKNNKQD